MSKYTFLYKENTDDRDCCAYIKLDDLRNKHLCCDGKFNINGACYSSSLGGNYHNVNYEDIKTILTKEEYAQLCNPDGTDLTSIIEKLESKANQELFEEVIEEEKEYLMDKYGFDEDDIEQIFDEYYLDYRDRGIVGCVFDDVEDLGYEEAWSLGYIQRDSPMERYFDFEKFGEDLLEDECYMQLSDGRCVTLNY